MHHSLVRQVVPGEIRDPVLCLHWEPLLGVFVVGEAQGSRTKLQGPRVSSLEPKDKSKKESVHISQMKRISGQLADENSFW